MIERIQFPGLATGFHEAPAAFPFSPAFPQADAAKGSGDYGPLGGGGWRDSLPASESDRRALDLWRQYRAAQARQAALDAQCEAAEAAMPWPFRSGPKFIGQTLREEDARMVTAWPAITDREPLKYGRINIRPSPDELFERYQSDRTTPRPFAAPETDDQRRERAFDRFAADVAALAARLTAQREARRAVRLDELESEYEAVADACLDLKEEILALPCDGPHALAAVALLRMEAEAQDFADLPAPNPRFWRALLERLRGELTGEIAEAVAEALARADEEEADEDEEEADEDEEEADESP